MSVLRVLPLALALQACAGMVPRPEPLSEEPLGSESPPPPRPTQPRAAQRVALGSCLPKLLAERGRVTMARSTSKDELAFCMRPDAVGEELPAVCFEWNLDSHELRAAKPFESPPPLTKPPALPANLLATEDAIQSCDEKKKCSTIVSAKVFSKIVPYRRDLENKLLARASADGKLLALVHVPPGMTDDGAGEIDVFDVATKKRLQRFRVSSQAHGDQVGSMRFVGSLLLVEQCDAGPYCTGRLFDPASGKQPLEVPINFYGSEVYSLDDIHWVFVDGWLERAVIVDISPPHRVILDVKSGHAGPAEDAGRVTIGYRGEPVLVYSGGAELAGGSVIRLSFEPSEAPKLDVPPICGE